MKLNPLALGNAFGGATAITFLICGVGSFLAPDLFVSFAKASVHVFDLSSIVPASRQPFAPGSFLLGWIGFSVLMWVFGWLLGSIYDWSTKGSATA